MPPPEVVEPLDFERILATMKADVIALHPAIGPKLALESEPVTKLLEVFAYRELLWRARVNDAARGVMLAYAVGSDLDHLAALYGVQRLADEDDDRLRMRSQLAMEGFSTAGPRLSYVFHALSSSNAVRDVSVSSPAPGEVSITVLSQIGAHSINGVPDAALLATVLAACNGDSVRPLADHVVVAPAVVHDYPIVARIYCHPEADSAASLDLARSAGAAYAEDQFRLGYDITLSGLHRALHQPGVTRVDVADPPAGMAAASGEAYRCTGVTVTFAGTEI